MATNTYPVQLSVDYPDRQLDRLTSALRIFTAIPIVIVLCALAGGNGSFTWDEANHELTRSGGGGLGLLVAAPLLMILFREKYPRWWFDWNLELLRFMNRVGVYFALMDDRYPSTDDHQAVRLELPEPA